jgi:hypothetical protein
MDSQGHFVGAPASRSFETHVRLIIPLTARDKRGGYVLHIRATRELHRENQLRS